MTQQPTESTSVLPVRPANGFKRPPVMAALALTEHLIAAAVPVPTTVTILAPFSPGGEATVRAYAHHDLDALLAWQAAFGGEIRSEVQGDRDIYSVLTGRVYDAPFEIWTLRRISEAHQATERQMCVRWCEEHGALDDWAPETRALYADLVLRFRLAVAE